MFVLGKPRVLKDQISCRLKAARLLSIRRKLQWVGRKDK